MVCLSRSNELWVYDQVHLLEIIESSLNSFMYDWVTFASIFELSVWFGLLDWSFLQWEKCLPLSSILWCPYPVDRKGCKAHIVLFPSRIKRWGLYHIAWVYPSTSCHLLNALLCSYELNTLDACWIAVDVLSNSSRCRIVLIYLSRTWFLYKWSYLDILITMLNSINCSTVIHLPTVILMLLREATSETYAPRVYLLSYKLSIYFYLHLYFLHLYYKIPKIYQSYLY